MIKIISLALKALGLLLLWGMYTLFVFMVPVGFAASLFLTITNPDARSDQEITATTDLFMNEHGWFLLILSAILAVNWIISDVERQRKKAG